MKIKRVVQLLLASVGLVAASISSHAADYYVSPTGSASWPQCQNIATPCSGKTAVLNAQAGDVVYFRTGVYDPAVDPVQEWIDTPDAYKYERLPWNPAHSGDEGNPITFKAYPGETPVFVDNPYSGAFGAANRNWIVWDGFSASIVDLPGEPIALTMFWQSEHCTIRNSHLTGLQKNSHDNSALVWLQNAHFSLVENNVLRGMNDDGVDNGDMEEANNSTAVLNFYSANISVRNNDLIDNYYGIWDKATEQHNHFYRNHIWGGDSGATRCRAGIHLNGQGPHSIPASDEQAYQNIIRNCDVGVFIDDSPWENNLPQVFNNVIFHAENGRTGIHISNQARNASVYNNIISGYGVPLRYYTPLGSSIVQSDFNAYYSSGIMVWNLDYAVDHESLPSWSAATSLDAHSLVSNPLFVNAGGTQPGDYQLSAGSTLSGRGLSGVNLGAYIVGTELIGYQAGTAPPPPPPVLSTDASLSALSLSTGQLTPAFAAETLGYSASVTHDVTGVFVTPAVTESHASVSVNGVTIAAGGSSGRIDLNIGSNPITVQITAQDGVTTRSYALDVTRAAPPPPLPEVSFSTSAAAIQENIGTLSLTLSRNASNGITTASYNTSPGSATAGVDYAAVTGSVSWADGESGDKTIYVAINNDAIREETETFDLNLIAVTGGLLGAMPHFTVSILDDDMASSPPPPPPAPTGQGQIQAGTRHSYALTPGGVLYAWGSNNYGQLGIGTRTSSNLPVPVSGMTGLKRIHAGYANLFALKQDGTIWSWGWNLVGQLGLGYARPYYVQSPQLITELDNVHSIAPATNYTAVLKADGSILGVGQNGASEASLVPLQVTGLDRVASLASGGAFTLALREDGTVWAWGSNSYGQLGDGSTTARAMPAQIAGLTDIVELAAGENHALALQADGSVWAWGYNKYGQLGDNSTTARNSPVKLAISDVIAIYAAQSGDHSLAICSDGSVWGWGRNGSGQLGDGSNKHRKSPVRIQGLGNVVQLAAGELHTLALMADGSLWGWGNNASGQLSITGSGPFLTPMSMGFGMNGL